MVLLGMENLENTISYCGLVCGLCSNSECTGCKEPINKNDKCAKEICIHRNCSIQRNIKGCWEWEDYPCEKGRFSDENMGQTIGFMDYIRKYGETEFIKKLVINHNNSIKCGRDGSYYHQPLTIIRQLLGE